MFGEAVFFQLAGFQSAKAKKVAAYNVINNALAQKRLVDSYY